MKTGFCWVVLAIVLLMTGCGDGVPTVDDPDNIVVNGEKMTKGAFLDKYCVGKRENETCRSVAVARMKDSTRGEMPKW